jgi:hypothetical protein
MIRWTFVFSVTPLTVGCVKFSKNSVPTAKTTVASPAVHAQSDDSGTEIGRAKVEAAERFVRFSVNRSVLMKREDSRTRELSDLIEQVSLNCQMRLSLKLRDDLVRSSSERIPVAVDFWVERKGQSSDDLSQLGSTSLTSLYVPDVNAADRILSGEAEIELAVAEIHGKLRSMLRNVLRSSPMCGEESSSSK